MTQIDPQTDALTGLLKRKVFLEKFNTAIIDAQAENAMVSFALLDIDQFFRVNEDFGHEIGDNVLFILATFIKENIPADAIPARFGGDEFAILFPNTDREQAFLTLERIRTEMERHHSIVNGNQKVIKGITISGGIASYPIDGRSGSELIRMADQALYRAKESGRDKIRLAYGERMVPKTTHFTLTQLERLSNLAKERDVGEAEILREALDDLLIKYGVNDIET